MSRNLVAATAAALLAGSALAASAAEPAAAYRGLDQGYFRSVVQPQAKPGGLVTVYAEDKRFLRFFTETVAPRFAKAHGIAVRFVVKPADVILAELANARAEGEPGPADLLLVGERTQRRILDDRLAMPFALTELLPHARDIDPDRARVADGAPTAGIAVPFHVDRQVVAYDSRKIEPRQIADLAALATFAAAEPGRFGYARSTGVAASFTETVTLALAGQPCLARVYDTDLTPAAAETAARGICGQAVSTWFKAVKPHATVTRTPAELLLKLSHGEVTVAVTGEQDVAEAGLRGALPPSIRVTAIPHQVVESTGLMVAAGTPDFAAALVLADDLMSPAVQRAKLEAFGSASPKAGVRPAPAHAQWFAASGTGDPSVRMRPVSTLADAIAAKVFGAPGDLAAR